MCACVYACMRAMMCVCMYVMSCARSRSKGSDPAMSGLDLMDFFQVKNKPKPSASKVIDLVDGDHEGSNIVFWPPRCLCCMLIAEHISSRESFACKFHKHAEVVSQYEHFILKLLIAATCGNEFDPKNQSYLILQAKKTSVARKGVSNRAIHGSNDPTWTGVLAKVFNSTYINLFDDQTHAHLAISKDSIVLTTKKQMLVTVKAKRDHAACNFLHLLHPLLRIPLY